MILKKNLNNDQQDTWDNLTYVPPTFEIELQSLISFLNEIAGVQPMAEPVGQIFKIKHTKDEQE
jgi:hypothetical protein